MCETTASFYLQTRAFFPALAERADREYLKEWATLPQAGTDFYGWFGSVATALNFDMCRASDVPERVVFFNYVSSVLAHCSAEVKTCIDVSLVENLFWQVSPAKAQPCWDVLPSQLRELYLEFHRVAPA